MNEVIIFLILLYVVLMFVPCKNENFATTNSQPNSSTTHTSSDFGTALGIGVAGIFLVSLLQILCCVCSVIGVISTFEGPKPCVPQLHHHA